MCFNHSFHIYRLSWIFTAAYLSYLNHYSMLCQGKEHSNSTSSLPFKFWNIHEPLIFPWGGTKSQHRDLDARRNCSFLPPRSEGWTEWEICFWKPWNAIAQESDLLLLQLAAPTSPNISSVKKVVRWFICRILNIAILADQDKHTQLKIKMKKMSLFIILKGIFC